MQNPPDGFGVIFGLFALTFLAAIIATVYQVVNVTTKRGVAKEDYYLALKQFREDPSNQDLKQRALELGRQYSRYTRNQYGYAFFDEAAIKNDLDAISATTRVIVEPAKPSVADRLKTLDELRDQGLITEDEYTERRSGILNDI